MDKGEPRGESPVTLDEVMAEAASMLLAPVQEDHEITVTELKNMLKISKSRAHAALQKHYQDKLLTRRQVLLRSTGKKGFAYAPVVDIVTMEHTNTDEDAYIHAWKELIVKISEA